MGNQLGKIICKDKKNRQIFSKVFSTESHPELKFDYFCDMRIKKFIIVWKMGMTSVFAQMLHTDDIIVKHYAQYMNVSDSMIHVPELYITFHEWMGTPYRYGRSDKKGTDCSGFVRNVFLPLTGEELPRSASDMSKVIQSKPKTELKEGDLVFFNERGRSNSHVGIYLQKGWFVHASIYRGVTLNNLNAPYYTRLFSKGGSLKRGELKDIMLRPPDNREETPPFEPLFPIRIPHFNIPHPTPTLKGDRKGTPLHHQTSNNKQ